MARTALESAPVITMMSGFGSGRERTLSTTLRDRAFDVVHKLRYSPKLS